MNLELTKEAETIAKRLAKEAGQSEGMFELFLEGAYKELSATSLTVAKLKTIEPGTIFATGFAMDSETGVFMANTGKKLRWVAVKGHGYDDWCIYVHLAEHDEHYVKSQGDKVGFEAHIRRCVECDDEALALYRR